MSLTGSIVEKAGADSLTSGGGCQGGAGFQVGRPATGQIGHANLVRDTIETYQ